MFQCEAVVPVRVRLTKFGRRLSVFGKVSIFAKSAILCWSTLSETFSEWGSSIPMISVHVPLQHELQSGAQQRFYNWNLRNKLLSKHWQRIRVVRMFLSHSNSVMLLQESTRHETWSLDSKCCFESKASWLLCFVSHIFVSRLHELCWFRNCTAWLKTEWLLFSFLA